MINDRRATAVVPCADDGYKNVQNPSIFICSAIDMATGGSTNYDDPFSHYIGARYGKFIHYHMDLAYNQTYLFCCIPTLRRPFEHYYQRKWIRFPSTTSICSHCRNQFLCFLITTYTRYGYRRIYRHLYMLAAPVPYYAMSTEFIH